MYSELKGLKAALWIRCSSLQQASTSMNDQEEACRAFAQAQGIEVVDTVRMPGKSASIRMHVQRAVDGLIARKIRANDFDAIMVYDLSRFTRTPPRHALRLLDELEAAKISLIPAVGYVRRNDFSDLSDVYSFFMNREHAKRIAAGVARGSQSSLIQGRRAHCARAPYGIDKVIIASDGREVHRLRDLPDGSQMRMDPQTLELVEIYPPNKSGETSSHYRKTKEQRVQLVPGDSAAVAVVRRIYERCLIGKAGYWKIAKELNEGGVASPSGKAWSMGAIRQIVANPTYRGIGLANRTTNAIYYKRSASMPEAAEARRETLEGRPAQQLRPEQEWVRLEYPALAEFLPEALREPARTYQEGQLQRHAAGREAAPRKDKHGASDYLLKNILRSRQGDHPMTGRSVNSKYRYYLVSRAHGIPTKDSTLRRRIPAEPVERAALTALSDILRRAPVRREEVIRQTIAWQREQQRGSLDRSEIEKQLAQIDRETNLLIKQVHQLGEEYVEAGLVPLAQQRRALKARLESTQEWPRLDEHEIAELTDVVLAGLQEQGSNLEAMPRQELRRLLEIFIESAVVDLETGRIELTMAVPNWAALASGQVGLDCCSVYRGTAEANNFAFFRQTSTTDLGPRHQRHRAA